MKKIYFVLPTIISIFILVSCSKKGKHEGHSHQPQVVTKYFVKGNPMVLVKGATMDNSLEELNINMFDYNNFRLAHISFFLEKELIQENRTSVEEGNEATEEDLSKHAADIYQFIENEDGLSYFSTTRKKEKFSYHFKRVDNKLKLTSLSYNDVHFPAEILHFSVKDGDKSSFSFLLKIKGSDDEVVLMSTVFVKEYSNIEIAETDSKFRYLYGPGVKIAWDREKEIKINVCGHDSLPYNNFVKKGIYDWQNALEGFAVVKTDFTYTYPPFSDVNSQCIYVVHDYLQLKDKRLMNPASTLFTANLSNGKFVDSDIFLWNSEINKERPYISNGIFSRKMQRTMTHEIGHALGLDHQFDGTESVMSYDPKHKEISDYDKQAIQELYSN